MLENTKGMILMDCKYNKILQISDRKVQNIFDGEVEVTEKLDGANFSFYINDDNEVICRSRNHESPAHGFNAAIEFVSKRSDMIIPGYIYFGEAMIKHAINYGMTPPFIGYGVFDIHIGIYLSNWDEYFKHVKLPHVTRHIANMSRASLDKFLNVKSAWGTEGAIAEGIVVKNYASQMMAKIVTPSFYETKSDKKKVVSSVVSEESKKIANMYCTPARVHKKIFVLRDEYNMPIEMRMMMKLPAMVTRDILDECMVDIYDNFKDFDLATFKKCVTTNCKNILMEYNNKYLEE